MAKKYDWKLIFAMFGHLHARAIAREIDSSANVVIEASRREGITLPIGEYRGATYPWEEIFSNEIGESIVDIAQKYKISINTVSRASVKLGLNIPYSHFRRISSKRYDWDAIFLANKGKNANEISLICGADRITVVNASKRFGYKLPNGNKKKSERRDKNEK
jgi:hypothetical protein